MISANEWRDREDMNRRRDPAGDDYIIERNMGPSEIVTAEQGDDSTS